MGLKQERINVWLLWRISFIFLLHQLQPEDPVSTEAFPFQEKGAGTIFFECLYAIYICCHLHSPQQLDGVRVIMPILQGRRDRLKKVRWLIWDCPSARSVGAGL
jgi:hypothetical protein